MKTGMLVLFMCWFFPPPCDANVVAEMVSIRSLEQIITFMAITETLTLYPQEGPSGIQGQAGPSWASCNLIVS